MTIAELIQMAEHRLSHLNQQRLNAELRGDAASITQIDEEIAQTNETLTALRSLSPAS